MPSPTPLLGLAPQSSNAEIKDAAFDFALSARYMFFATVSLDGATPNNRGLEVHRLDDHGNIYVGMSRGKLVYAEVTRHPYVAASISKSTASRHAIGLRISAKLREVDDPEVTARYWAQNPGTRKLYRRDLENFRIFIFESGEGELFTVTAEEDTYRLRFSFGEAERRKPLYRVTDACTGCGACTEKCLTGAMVPGEKYSISHLHCQECGNCYFYCPSGAVLRQV